MPKAPPRYHAAIRATQSRLDELVAAGGIAKARSLFRGVEVDLQRDLAKLRAGTFDHARKQQAMLQVKAAMLRLSKESEVATAETSVDAQLAAIRVLGRQVADLEHHFSGVVQPVPLLEAARFTGVASQNATSLLVQHRTSMARYGASVIGKIEGVMAHSLLSADQNAVAVDKILATFGGERWQAERIHRTECLPGSTRVDAAVVRAVHRRWYEGDMVEVVTEGGRHLAATPNHPMLARRGWVGAGGLSPGDDLVCDRRQQDPSASRHEDVDDGPATIDEIFSAVAAVGGVERTRGRQPDFHGDGCDGDVDAARPDGALVVGDFAPIRKPLAEQVLTPSALAGSRFCDRCLLLLAVESSACDCDGPGGDPGLPQSSKNPLVRHTDLLSDRRGSDSGEVPLNDPLSGDVFPVPRMTWAKSPDLGLRSGHASGANGIHYPVDPSTESRGYLRSAEAGQVEFDRVISVRRVPYVGHVYNLTTSHGYFSIIGGLYTGNTAWSYARGATEGIVAQAQAMPDLRQRWCEHVADDSGAPLDDRVGVDSLAMHGQVVPPGGLFTQPPEAPDGQEVSDSLVLQTWPHPPNRPNDRAVVQAWRPHWKVPAWTWQGRRVPYVGGPIPEVSTKPAAEAPPPLRSMPSRAAAPPPPAPPFQLDPAPGAATERAPTAPTAAMRLSTTAEVRAAAGDLPGARRSIDDSLRSAGLYDRRQPDRGVMTGPLPHGIDALAGWDGAITLSEATAKRLDAFSRQWADNPQAVRIAYLRQTGNAGALTAAERQYAAANADTIDRIGYDVVHAMDAQRALHHEAIHGYGPITPDRYEGHVAAMEEVATESLARRAVADRYGVPVRRGAGAYQAEVDHYVGAISEAYGIDRDAAWDHLGVASRRYKATPPGHRGDLAERFAAGLPAVGDGRDAERRAAVLARMRELGGGPVGAAMPSMSDEERERWARLAAASLERDLDMSPRLTEARSDLTYQLRQNLKQTVSDEQIEAHLQPIKDDITGAAKAKLARAEQVMAGGHLKPVPRAKLDQFQAEIAKRSRDLHRIAADLDTKQRDALEAIAEVDKIGAKIVTLQEMPEEELVDDLMSDLHPDFADDADQMGDGIDSTDEVIDAHFDASDLEDDEAVAAAAKFKAYRDARALERAELERKVRKDMAAAAKIRDPEDDEGIVDVTDMRDTMREAAAGSAAHARQAARAGTGHVASEAELERVAESTRSMYTADDEESDRDADEDDDARRRRVREQFAALPEVVAEYRDSGKRALTALDAARAAQEEARAARKQLRSRAMKNAASEATEGELVDEVLGEDDVIELSLVRSRPSREYDDAHDDFLEWESDPDRDEEDQPPEPVKPSAEQLAQEELHEEASATILEAERAFRERLVQVTHTDDGEVEEHLREASQYTAKAIKTIQKSLGIKAPPKAKAAAKKVAADDDDEEDDEDDDD